MTTIRVAILTVSDRSFQGVREDLSGPAINDLIVSWGWQPIAYDVVPDEIDEIKEKLIAWVEILCPDIILTTGGTGFAPRDVTPEATLQVLEKKAPGLVEIMRQESYKITPHAMLSRAEAGIRKKTLIINLPGSPKGALENLSYIKLIIPHAVELLTENPQAEKGHRLSS